MKLARIQLNVTGEALSPTPVAPGAELGGSEPHDLIEQWSAADLLVYHHALARTGFGAPERLRAEDDAFARRLAKMRDLAGRRADA